MSERCEICDEEFEPQDPMFCASCMAGTPSFRAELAEMKQAVRDLRAAATATITAWNDLDIPDDAPGSIRLLAQIVARTARLVAEEK